MATYTKVILSGSTNGRNILISNSGSPTTIHTAISGTSDMDEIWLWAQNTHSADLLVTVRFGGTTDPNDFIETNVSPQYGNVLIVPGWILQNSLVVTAFAATASLVSINGFVNRITA